MIFTKFTLSTSNLTICIHNIYLVIYVLVLILSSGVNIVNANY